MKIPLFKNFWSSKDLLYTQRVIKRGMYWANGPEIEEFEKKVARISQQKYAVAFNSGTSALFGILSTLDVKGKEVIVPSFTFISTATSVVHAGGKVVFADVEKETFGLNPRDVEKKITSKTAVIMPVHLAGNVCQIGELKKIARKNKLHLIEDAAQALGAKSKGKSAGSFGLASMFSFTPVKIISTGEGGVATTSNRQIYNRLKLIRSHGRKEKKDYFTSTEYMDYVALGYGMRMSTLTAAQGLAQLTYLEKLIKKRRKIARYYNEKLNDLKEIVVPIEFTDNYQTYQMYTIRVLVGRKSRNKLQSFLEQKGVASKVYFEPVHKSHYFRKILKNSPELPITEELSGQVLSLPIFPQLTVAQQNYVVRVVRSFFDRQAKSS